MTETDFSKWLEKDYLEAKKHFEKPNLTHSIENLKNEYHLNYDLLKIEVEKLGYHIELAENIKNKHWQKVSSIGPLFVFYKNEGDL